MSRRSPYTFRFVRDRITGWRVIKVYRGYDRKTMGWEYLIKNGLESRHPRIVRRREMR